MAKTLGTVKDIFQVSKDNPFKEAIERLQKTRRVTTDHGEVFEDEVTVTMKRTYFPFGHTKIYQNKELLQDLSPEACKVLIHIALNMSYNDEKVKISQKEVGLSRRRLPPALLELRAKNIIISADKREWYWINVTLLIVGRLEKTQERT